MTLDALQAITASVREQLAKDPKDRYAHIRQSWTEYMVSMHFLGENTLENAKRIGYLDARELYPDMPQWTLEDFAKDFYTMADPGATYRSKD